MNLEKEILKYLFDRKDGQFHDLSPFLQSLDTTPRAIVSTLGELLKETAFIHDNLIEKNVSDTRWTDTINSYKNVKLSDVKILVRITKLGATYYTNTYKDEPPHIKVDGKENIVVFGDGNATIGGNNKNVNQSFGSEDVEQSFIKAVSTEPISLQMPQATIGSCLLKVGAFIWRNITAFIVATVSAIVAGMYLSKQHP